MKKQIAIFFAVIFVLMAPICFAIMSNDSIDNEDFSDISDWTLSGSTDAAQVTFDSESCMLFDSGVTVGWMEGPSAYKDTGDIESGTSTFTVSCRLYFDAIGTISDYDFFQIQIQYGADLYVNFGFASDGLYAWNSGWNEIGTNEVTQDAWNVWTFEIDVSSGVTDATADVYVGSRLIQRDVNVWTPGGGAGVDGKVILWQFSWQTANRITYVDYLLMGDGTEWTHDFMGVSNADIGYISGVSIEDIQSVGGVQ